MDDMEREALRRAERMRGAFYSDRNVHKEGSKPPTKENPIKNENSEKKKEIPPKQSENKSGKKSGDIFDILLKDKEATIIILMIFFLYDDNCDPMLLMALVYLLI